MRIGSLIKFYRTKRGLTQNSLAMGICSVPHLSKIENNSKEANVETIRLLLERLSIDLQDVQANEWNILELLKEFLSHIHYLEEEKAKNAYKQLEGYRELIVFTDFIYLYELYKLRYYLLINNREAADYQLKWLHAQRQNFSQYEKYLLLYFGALILMLRGRYEEADRQLTRIIQDKAEMGTFEGEIYYHLAVVKGHVDEASLAIIYGKKALQFYSNQYNFKRILHTLMSLALNYSRAKIFNEALETYNHLLRSIEMLNQKHLLPKIYHNIGDLHQRMGDYKQAVEYFQKSAAIIPKDTENYLLCLYNLAQTQFRLEQWDECRESFTLLKMETKKQKVLHYRLFTNFYLLLLDNEKEKAMLFLEEKLVPYTARVEDFKEAHHQFLVILTDYYRQEGKFEKVVQLTNQ